MNWESSNALCVENTDKRLESQLKTIKLHRIKIKVHKIKCFTRTKISSPVIFLNLHQNFVDPSDPHHLYQSLTIATHERTNTTCATHAIYDTRKINVNRNNNGLTTTEAHHRYSYSTYSRFWELALDGGFKIYLKRKEPF